MESLAQDPARSFDSATLRQCVVVLFERAPELSALRPLLQRYPMTGEGPLGLSLSMKPELDGEIRVEIVAAPFPDDGPAEVWSSQPFGALATVGALARATQHAWTFPEAAELVGRHRAFVRVATVPAPMPDVGARVTSHLPSWII